MSGKFMKVKRYVIPTITMVIIASQLMGCAAMSSDQLLDAINRGEQIEIEVASPDFAVAEQGTEDSILWEQLASLTTNTSLRKDWDNVLMITTTETGKNGMLYVNVDGNNENNNTLAVAIHNREFQKQFENEDSLTALANGALSNYADLDAEDEYKAFLMGVNGYFNLLPDAVPNYSNADSTLQRNEFMAMVFRADTPVSELEANEAFATAVGQSDLNIYAQGTVDNSYLDLASKSLNNQTYNGSITRAEAIYLLVNRYFADELKTVEVNNGVFSDAKDGGNIAEQRKYIEKGTAKDYWKSYELTYALTNPDGGLPTDLYKALLVAKQVGLINSNETRWDEALTRAEAVDLIITALMKDNSISTFNYKQGTISGYEAPVDESTEEKIDLSGANDNDNVVSEGDPEEETSTPEEETPTEETPTEETPVEEPTEEEFKLTDEDIQVLKIMGATDSQIKAVKSQSDLDKLINLLINNGINGGGSGSGSGNNSGGRDDYDPSMDGNLGDPDDTVPGSM